ncbi:MAG TPA: prepilin-type N-terminal cleavage/methylation domain-containing protein, partial [Leucothrix mucor]|nr:prepilin-type N-terminal cleavage/methylation domain-containing protein [Leucothrix mucor]
MSASACKGFTLIEVMVALLIIAVSLSGAVKVMG